MPRDQDKAALKRMLDLCQRVAQTSESLATGVPPTQARRLRDQRREYVKTLLGACADPESAALPALFREVGRRAALDERELVLLLFLVERRISNSDPELEGRELLQLLSGSSFDLLKHGEVLHAEGRLVVSGLVHAYLPHPEATLEGLFRVSERFFRRFMRQFHGRKPQKTNTSPPQSYATVIDHLVDLRHLVSLFQHRAAGLFPESLWIDVHPDSEDRPQDLSETITQARHAIRSRERQSEHALPFVAFREEFGLDPDEEIVVLTLLFRELFSSAAVVESAELVRLVSASEEEVFKKRSLLTPGSRLLEAGLVLPEADYDEKPLLTGVFLAEWIIERLLHGIDLAAGIRQDERNRFHDFLEGLDSSEDFYRNL